MYLIKYTWGSLSTHGQTLTLLLFVGLVASEHLPPAPSRLPEGPVVTVRVYGVLDGGHQLIEHLVISQRLDLQHLSIIRSQTH